MSSKGKALLAKRFRGFYPVVIDIETAGFDPKKNPILEIAAILLKMDDEGILMPGDILHHHVAPFQGSKMEAAALEFTGIQPYNPFRLATAECEVLESLFGEIQEQVKNHACQRAVMVAHNAVFDQSFLQAAVKRCKVEKDPFHQFTTFDTAALSGLVFGQTVLARAVKAAGIEYDKDSAHSAKYDAQITAELFCHIVNKWKDMGGWHDAE